MGIAAYNRGSRLIREMIDRELRERHVMTRRAADRFHCEQCGAKLGVRLDRGCSWSNRLSRWVNVCFDCKRRIELENAGRL